MFPLQQCDLALITIFVLTFKRSALKNCSYIHFNYEQSKDKIIFRPFKKGGSLK